MAARGSFVLTDPEKVDMTLRITMSVKEWKIIKGRLQPSTMDAEWQLNDTINQMIDKAGKEFNFYEEVQK